jgi:RES domain-containing protein
MPTHIRDNALLDTLEQFEQSPFNGIVWRSVRQGRDPLDCSRAGGRWDDRSFDVLYTSETRECAVEERRFHLYRGQPVLPSKIHLEMFELRVELSSVVTFETLDDLKAVGMHPRGFGGASYSDRESEYPRPQEIAEACFFLGADGIFVPSARHPSSNLIVFCEQDTDPAMEIVRSHGRMVWS